MTKTPKRPRDPNQLAKLIADIATGEGAEKEKAAPSPGRPNASKAGKNPKEV